MDITVNLANEPYIDSRPIIRGLRISMIVAAALSVIIGSATFFVHRKAQESLSREHALEATTGSLQAEQRAYQNIMRSSVAFQTARQAEELNQIFDAKAFSWTAVMQDLEGVLPTKVQVTAIEPARTKEGTTYLHLRVVGPHEKSIDLLRNLEDSRRFVQPRIVGESLANNAGSGQKSVAVDASTMMEFDLMTEYDASAPNDAIPAPSTDGKRWQQSAEDRASSQAITHDASASLRKHAALNGGAH